MTVPPPPPPPPKTKSGCWKWGAIGCGAALVLGAIAIGVIVTIVFGAIKSTDAYKEARRRAESDPRVIAALGSPVKAGFFVTGKVNVDNRGGNADMGFPISGPNGKAHVHVVASRDSSGWHYSTLKVEFPDRAPIDLLQP